MLTSKPMMQVLSRRDVMKSFLLLATFLFLTACTPKLDWRSVQSPQEGYTTLFPGKPERMERKLPYQDEEILQTLEAVKIDDDIYSVSSIYLNQGQVTLLPKLLNQLQDNPLQRAGVDFSTAMSSDASYQMADHQRRATKDYFLEFRSGVVVQQSMRVRWITQLNQDKGAWIYQISVLHTAPTKVDAKKFFSEEQYANFFDEFHPD
jgi:hypothetical protein